MSRNNNQTSMGDRAKALAQRVITATGAETRQAGQTFLYGHAEASLGERHESELVVAAISYLNFTGWSASAHRPWFWQRRKKSDKPGDGQVEWVVKLRKK